MVLALGAAPEEAAARRHSRKRSTRQAEEAKCQAATVSGPAVRGVTHIALVNLTVNLSCLAKRAL